MASLKKIKLELGWHAIEITLKTQPQISPHNLWKTVYTPVKKFPIPVDSQPKNSNKIFGKRQIPRTKSVTNQRELEIFSRAGALLCPRKPLFYFTDKEYCGHSRFLALYSSNIVHVFRAA